MDPSINDLIDFTDQSEPCFQLLDAVNERLESFEDELPTVSEEEEEEVEDEEEGEGNHEEEEDEDESERRPARWQRAYSLPLRTATSTSRTSSRRSSCRRPPRQERSAPADLRVSFVEDEEATVAEPAEDFDERVPTRSSLKESRRYSLQPSKAKPADCALSEGPLAWTFNGDEEVRRPPAVESPAGPPNSLQMSNRQSEEDEDGHDVRSDDEPLEMKSRDSITENISAPAPYCSTSVWHSDSPLPRHRSFQDERFVFHRDSVELARRRLNEERMNDMLMTTRDSFVITKSKYETKYPKSGVTTGVSRLQVGSLPPILDSSPPDARSGMKMMAKGTSALRHGKQAEVEDRSEPDEHGNCAICAVERPERSKK